MRSRQKYRAGLSFMCSATDVSIDTAKGGTVRAEMALRRQLQKTNNIVIDAVVHTTKLESAA